MFGKNPRLNPLDLRKQLLLAESELNRAQLVLDLTALKADVGAFADRGKWMRSIFSSAATLAAGLTACGNAKSADSGAKHPWLQTIFRGAGVLSDLWTAFRSKERGQQEG